MAFVLLRTILGSMFREGWLFMVGGGEVLVLDGGFEAQVLIDRLE